VECDVGKKCNKQMEIGSGSTMLEDDIHFLHFVRDSYPVAQYRHHQCVIQRANNELKRAVVKVMAIFEDPHVVMSIIRAKSRPRPW